MTLRLPRLRLRLPPECIFCGSSRYVRNRRCRECRAPEPLERRLEARGWSVAELARRARVGPASIHRLLAGERVSDDVRDRIAAAVRLPADRLVRPRRTP